MISEAFKIVRSRFRTIVSNIQNRFIRDSILIIVFLALGVVFLSLVTRFLNIQSAIGESHIGNYSLAKQEFDVQQQFFELDSWKKNFNDGVVYYMMDNQTAARENFQKAKDLLEQIGDNENLCKVDIDIAFTYEKDGVTLSSKTTDPESLRSAAEFYLQSLMLRSEISAKCQVFSNSETLSKSLETNDSLLDDLYSNYNKLINDAFNIDGKVVENQVESMVNEADSRRLSSITKNDSTTNKPKQESDAVEDKKAGQILESMNSSEEDYRKAHDLVNSKQDDKVVKPW